ncbi:MAG TPA: peptide chain release factor-like protein [Deltaproteobacteria bacterium]|nr:peptide chain release factor-like protein [Deltaproteobacteria bacterium]
MLNFAVSEEKNKWLKEKMESLGIREEDIIEKFVRSSGKGGQKVNKTSTCVYIKHSPTGIEVKCMKDRSQSINRFLARRELIERIERLSGKLTNEDIKRFKAKKQKLKRHKRAKLKHKAEVVDKASASEGNSLEAAKTFVPTTQHKGE